MAPPQDRAAAFHAHMLRLWQAGRRDEVESALVPIAHHPLWRLLLAAARYIQRVEREPATRSPIYAAPEQVVFLHAILDFGHIDIASAFVAATDGTQPMPFGLSSLRLLVANAPAPSQPGFADDMARDVQVVPTPGAACALLVFTSGFHKFQAPLNLMHRWFGLLGASVVYLRDFNRLFYLQGIRSLGNGYAATLVGLRRIVDTLGVTRIACVGASSGSYGAMRIGLDLGAERVLCLAGPSMFDDSIPDLLARERLCGPFPNPIDKRRLNLALPYAMAPNPPRLRLVFGADHATDRREAANMRRVPFVERIPLPGLAHHSVVPRLVTDGTFSTHLRWAVQENDVQKETLSRMRERAG
jgi:hypothetical protein